MVLCEKQRQDYILEERDEVTMKDGKPPIGLRLNLKAYKSMGLFDDNQEDVFEGNYVSYSYFDKTGKKIPARAKVIFTEDGTFSPKPGSLHGMKYLIISW